MYVHLQEAEAGLQSELAAAGGNYSSSLSICLFVSVVEKNLGTR